MTTVAPSLYGATPDARYARGVTSGSLAELVGLGPRGVRWRQVAVIVIGIWLTGNASLLEATITGGVLGGFNILGSIFWPVAFVVSAITAVRSFQGALAVALFTGVAYSLLNTAIVFATRDSAIGGSTLWFPFAVSSFTWAGFRMLALAFAVAGQSRWLRMAGALVVAGIAQTFVTAFLYGQIFDVEQLVQAVAVDIVMRVVAAAGWTLTFWLGLRLVSHPS
jgi:hypothetical protein